jgi:hypothetical protein
VYEIDFLDIDLETEKARAQLKARCVDGWKLVLVEKSLHSTAEGRDFSRHLVIIERDTKVIK